MASYSAGTVKIKVRPDLDGFKAELEAGVASALASMSQKTVDVGVDVDTKAAQAKINALHGKTVHVNVTTDEKARKEAFATLEAANRKLNDRIADDNHKHEQAMAVERERTRRKEVAAQARQEQTLLDARLRREAQAERETHRAARSEQVAANKAAREVEKAHSQALKEDRLRAEVDAKRAAHSAVEREERAHHERLRDITQAVIGKGGAKEQRVATGVRDTIADLRRSESEANKVADAIAKRWEAAAVRQDASLRDMQDLTRRIGEQRARHARVSAETARTLANPNATPTRKDQARDEFESSLARLRRMEDNAANLNGTIGGMREQVRLLGDEFKDAVRASPRSKQELQDLAKTLASARRQALGAEEFADRGPGYSPAGNRLRVLARTEQMERSQKGSGLNERDSAAIQDAIKAASELDRIEAEHLNLLRQLNGVNGDVNTASLQRAQAIRSTTASLAQQNDAENRLNGLLDRQSHLTSRLDANRHVLARARVSFSEAETHLQTREGRGPLRRGIETVSDRSGDLLKGAISRLAATGSLLRNISIVSVAAAAGVAALGAVSLAPLLTSLLQVGNTLALLPAAAAGLGAIVASVAVGGSGVIGALKAAGAASKASNVAGIKGPQDTQSKAVHSKQKAVDNAVEQRGKAVERAADTVEQARRREVQAAKQVADAEKGIGDAYKDASRTADQGLRQIESAEKNVQNAQKNSVQSQKDLSQARKDAVGHIRDVNDALRGTALDERAARLAIARAQQNLGKTLMDPKADGLDRAEAQLNYEQAIQNLEDVQRRNQKLRDTAAETNQKGIEGDDNVVAAKERVVEANDKVVESQKDLQQTHKDADQANADAQEKIADAVDKRNEALQNQVQVQQDNAKDVARAWEEVADKTKDIQEATQELADAQADTGSQMSTQAAELEAALAKLSPNARKFVEDLRDMGASWTDLRLLVQDNLFAGLGDDIRVLADAQLPNLKRGLAEVAGFLNLGVRDSIKQLSTESAKTDFKQFLHNVGNATGYVSKAFGPATKIFTDLATVGSSFMPAFAKGLSDEVGKLQVHIAKMRDSGELSQMFDDAINKAKLWGSVIKDSFGVVRAVMHAVTGDGESILVNLATRLEVYRASLNDPDKQNSIRDFFRDAHKEFDSLMGIVKDAGSIINDVIIQPLVNGFGPLSTALALVAKAVDRLTSIPGVSQLIALFVAMKGAAWLGRFAGIPAGVGAASIGRLIANRTGVTSALQQSRLAGNPAADPANAAFVGPLPRGAATAPTPLASSTFIATGGGTATPQSRLLPAVTGLRGSLPVTTGNALSPIVYPSPLLRQGLIVPGVTSGLSRAPGTLPATSLRFNPSALNSIPPVGPLSTANANTPLGRAQYQANLPAWRQLGLAGPQSLNAANNATGIANIRTQLGQVAAAATQTGATFTGMFRGVQAAANTTGAGIASSFRGLPATLGGYAQSAQRNWRPPFQGIQSLAASAATGIGSALRAVPGQVQTAAGAVNRLPQVAMDAAGRAGGFLRTMGSGLAGMFGGLPGIMATGVIMGVGYLSSALDDAKEKTRRLDQAMTEFSISQKQNHQRLVDAFTNTGGIVDENVIGASTSGVQDRLKNYDAIMADRRDSTKSRVAEWWNSSSKLDVLRAGAAPLVPGLSTAGDFTRGNDKVQESVAKSDEAKAARDAILQVGRTPEEVGKILTGSSQAYEDFRQKLIALGDGGKKAASDMAEMRKSIMDAMDEGKKQSSTLDDLRNKMIGLSDATGKLKSSYDRVFADQMTVEQAQARSNQAIIDMRSSLEGLGAAGIETSGRIDTSTAAGQKLFDLTSNLADLSRGAAAAAATDAAAHGASDAQVVQAKRDAVAALVESFRQEAEAAGIPMPAIQALIDRYGLVPKEVDTKAVFDADEAQARIADLKKAMSELWSTGSDNAMSAVFMNGPGNVGNIVPDARSTADPAASGGTWPQNVQAAADGTPPSGQTPDAPQDSGPAPLKNTVPVSLPVPDYSGSLKAFDDYANAIQGGYQQKILPAFQGIIDKSAEASRAQITSIDDQQKAMSDLILGVSNVHANFEDHITNGALVEWAKLRPAMGMDINDITTNQFKVLTDALDNVAKKFGEAVGQIWFNFSGIKRAIAEPINWVITEVFNGGLKNAWNALKQVIPSLPEWNIQVQPIAGFHTGGIMSGYSPGVDDRVIAVGGGEAVMRPEWVRAVGPDYVHGANAAARQGGEQGVESYVKKNPRFAGEYARGGVVGGGSGMIWETLWNAVSTAFPNATLNSAYDPTPGRGNYHELGRAVDLGGPMQQIANWIFDSYPDSAQLIYGPGPVLLNSELNGRVPRDDQAGIRAAYGEGTMAGHYDHVHWGSDFPIASDGKMVSMDGASAMMAGGGRRAMGGMYRKFQEVFVQPLQQLMATIPNFGDSLMAKIPSGFAHEAIGKVTDYLKQQPGIKGGGMFGIMGGPAGSYSGAAGVEQWRPLVEKILAEKGQDPSKANLVLLQMEKESSGNPQAVNLTDSNAMAGTPSKGLMQVIDPTFQSYKDPGYDDIWDPESNIRASINYVLRDPKYGSLEAAYTGAGYDQGGWLPDGGFGFNKSGKPEPVFTHEQWGKLTELINTLGNAAPAIGWKQHQFHGADSLISDFSGLVGRLVNELRTNAPAGVATTTPAPVATLDSTGGRPYRDPGAPSGAPSAPAQPPTPPAGADESLKKADPNNLFNGSVDQREIDDFAKPGTLPAPPKADLGKQEPWDPNKDPLMTPPGPPKLNETTGLEPTPKMGDPGTLPPSWVDPVKPQDLGTGGPIPFGQPGFDPIQNAITGFNNAINPQRIMGAGQAFVDANINQFKSDLGFTGEGAIPQALSQVQKVVEEHVHYHVQDVEEAMRKNAIRQRQNALTFTGR